MAATNNYHIGIFPKAITFIMEHCDLCHQYIYDVRGGATIQLRHVALKLAFLFKESNHQYVKHIKSLPLREIFTTFPCCNIIRSCPHSDPWEQK